jgi:hypothetical protein
MLMKRGDMLSSPSADEVGGPRDVRAAVLEDEMAEQRFSVSASPTKTAATQRTSQRAERAIRQSAIRSERSEQSN